MSTDQALSAVAAAILAMDPTGERLAAAIRRTFDQLYDGRRTGRYRWDQLRKTEKTHCGTLVEINLQREFAFEDGLHLDYRIADEEVDCKYSQKSGDWMIPQEAMGHLCLVATANDQAAKWSVGLIRIQEHVLTSGENRDTKRTVSAQGRESILWLFGYHDLPPNILLQLPRAAVDELMRLRSGQRRIDQIFRIAQGRRISGTVIETLGQQIDPKKRVRGNGGSRSRLKPEGIIILGDYHADREIAQDLGVAVPCEGEFVAVRVAPAARTAQGVARIDGGFWRIASSTDPIVSAPKTPGQRRGGS